MSELQRNESNKLFLSVVAGSLRQSSSEGAEGAVKRNWEAGGKTGVKWEIPFTSIIGKIIDVKFYEGEADGRKFTSLNISLDEVDGKIPVISVGVKSRYAQDILKKLPNVDFSQPVRIRPFSFKPDGEDREIIGIEVTQMDSSGQFNKKITSFFHKKSGDKWVAQNGYPTPEGEVSEYSSDDWKVFYITVEKFLRKYIEENVSTRFEKEDYTENVEKLPEQKEINPEDIPFSSDQASL